MPNEIHDNPNVKILPFRQNIARFPGEPPLEGVPLRTEDSMFSDYMEPIKTPLPERSRLNIPTKSIQLVNQCLKASFPQQFGREIPKLNPQDIRVITNGNWEDYFKARYAEAGHSKVIADAAEMPRAAIEPDFAVIPELPDKPIFFKESMLTHLSGVPKSAAEGLIAFWLIHENLHRAPKTRVITDLEDTNLVKIGISSDLKPIFMEEDSKARNELVEKFSNLGDYILSNGPKVRIEGAIVSVFCRDEDGKLKQIAGRGYDMNEHITERLSLAPRQKLLQMIKEDKSLTNQDWFINLLQGNGSASAKVEILDPQVANSYLESLGIVSDADLLKAYIEGQIPFLHIEKKSQRDIYPK